MSVFEIVSILLAGVAAGAINAAVGSGTLVTFPVLISFGFPPVTATISNSLGLVPGGFSGTWGYRRELAGQKRRILLLVPASMLGALTGAWLLLNLPESVFESVVPALIVAALILVVAQPRIQKALAARAERREGEAKGSGRVWVAVMFVGVYFVGCYGGYFSAAQGILLVGVVGIFINDSLQRMNALKNLLALVVNVVAASAYIIVAFDRISWAAAGLIAAGSLVGGLIGSNIGRRLPEYALRGAIIVIGAVGVIRLLGG